MAQHKMKTTYYTLIFPINHNSDSILLGYKKRGFAKNTWNGFGGKLENSEDIFECAVRECKEECNIAVTKDDLKYLGYICCIENDENRIVYIFTTTNYAGTIKESDEMCPCWFRYDEIPYEMMLPDNYLWIHLVLKNCYFVCSFWYDGIVDGKKHLKKHEISRFRRPPKIHMPQL